MKVCNSTGQEIQYQILDVMGDKYCQVIVSVTRFCDLLNYVYLLTLHV